MKIKVENLSVFTNIQGFKEITFDYDAGAYPYSKNKIHIVVDEKDKGLFIYCKNKKGNIFSHYIEKVNLNNIILSITFTLIKKERYRINVIQNKIISNNYARSLRVYKEYKRDIEGINNILFPRYIKHSKLYIEKIKSTKNIKCLADFITDNEII